MRAACPPVDPLALPDLGAIAEALRSALARRERRVLDLPGRRAAVLILLYPRDGVSHLLLTKRTETLRHHRGQISLPGGRWEDEDRTLAVTALRETEEEVGVPRTVVDVLGAIDDVPTIATDFLVTPVVGVVHAAPVVVPNPIEIARVMEVPLAELLWHDDRLPAGLGPRDLRYPLDGEDVWGATARILRNFCRAVRCALNDTDAALADDIRDERRA